MTKKTFFILLASIILTLSGCSEERKDNAAALTAKELYDSLAAGNHACFVRGMYLPDTIPANYREQLETNMKMFLARMDEEHKGIKRVDILNYVNDTVASANGKKDILSSNVFLLLSFGDSLKEEVVVQMVEHNGKWLMK